MTEAHEATSNPESVFFARRAAELAKAGEYDQAITMLNEGLEHHGSYATGYQVLGDIHARRGDNGKAMEMFDRVLSLDPQNPRVLYLLGKLHLETDPARAQDLLWRARRYEPDVLELEQAFAEAISGPEEGTESDIDNDPATMFSEQAGIVEEDTGTADSIINDTSAETVIIDTSEPADEALAGLDTAVSEPETTQPPDEELDLSIVTEQALTELQADKRTDNHSDRPLDDRDALEELVATQSEFDTTPPEEMDEVDSELRHILDDFDENSEDISYLVGTAETGTEPGSVSTDESPATEEPSIVEELPDNLLDTTRLEENTLETLPEAADTDMTISGDEESEIFEEDLSVPVSSVEDNVGSTEESDLTELTEDIAIIEIPEEDINDIEPEPPSIDSSTDLEAPDEEPLQKSLVDTDELPTIDEDADIGSEEIQETETSNSLESEETTLHDIDLSYLYGGDKSETVEEDILPVETEEFAASLDIAEESSDTGSYASVLAEMDDLTDVEATTKQTAEMEPIEEQMIVADIELTNEETPVDSFADTGELPTTDEPFEPTPADETALDDLLETPREEPSNTDLSYLYGSNKITGTSDEAAGETPLDISLAEPDMSLELDTGLSDEVMIEDREYLSGTGTPEDQIGEKEYSITSASADESAVAEITSDSEATEIESTPSSSGSGFESDLDAVDWNEFSPAASYDAAPATEESGETVYEVTDEDHDAGATTEEEAITAYSKLLRDIDLSGIETDERDRGVLEIGEEELSSLTFDENSSDTIDEPVLSEEERAELSALESITDDYESIRSADNREDVLSGTESIGDMDYNTILGITDNAAELVEKSDSPAKEAEQNTLQEINETAASMEIVNEEEIGSVDLSDVLTEESERKASDDHQTVDTGKIVEEMMRGSMNIRLTPTSEDLEDVDRSSLDSLISEYVSTLGSLSETISPAVDSDAPATESETTPSPEIRKPTTSASNAAIHDSEVDSDDIQGESTATMAEIYVRQGLITRAIDIYARVVENQPDNAAAQARLNELMYLRDNASGDA